MLSYLGIDTETLIKVITTPSVIIGMCLAMIGLSLALLAKKVSKMGNSDQPESKRRINFLVMLCIGLVFIFAGLLVTLIR